jgi:hypothetical protein
MKLQIAEVHYASLENPHPNPAVTIENIDVAEAGFSRNFGQRQQLIVATDPPSFEAKVLMDKELCTRSPQSADWEIAQFTFRKKDTHQATVVTIFQ